MSFNDGRRNNGERAEVGESTSEVREERPEPARKSRLLTTASQKKLLQALLAISPFPNALQREEVAIAAGMSAHRVQIYFQNQRRRPQAVAPPRSDASSSVPPGQDRLPNPSWQTSIQRWVPPQQSSSRGTTSNGVNHHAEDLDHDFGRKRDYEEAQYGEFGAAARRIVPREWREHGEDRGIVADDWERRSTSEHSRRSSNSLNQYSITPSTSRLPSPVPGSNNFDNFSSRPRSQSQSRGSSFDSLSLSSSAHDLRPVNVHASSARDAFRQTNHFQLPPILRRAITAPVSLPSITSRGITYFEAARDDRTSERMGEKEWKPPPRKN